MALSENTAYLYPLESTDTHFRLKRHNEIGSDPLNTLILRQPTVSGFHAHIFQRSSSWILKDLSSQEGCWVNGVRVKEAELSHLDQVSLGKWSFLFSETELERTRPTSKNKEWDEQLQSLGHFAKTESPVLILGESGTGKDVLAQWIHRLSLRSQRPMTTINCSALSENLIESELFGHVRGSFTGATTDRKGAIESTRGGTLFLDEIGDLPLNLQPKLLRALENKEIRPVGSDQTLTCDVRVVAATHKPLEEMIAKGLFREDLYYRLNVCRVEVPKLIHRQEDFDTLFYSFAREAKVRFTFQALLELKKHNWPGNIRELKNVVFRAKAYFPGQDITPEKVLRLIDKRSQMDFLLASKKPEKQGYSVIKKLEQQLIIERLIFHKGNQRRVAEDLGIPRSTLNDRIRTYGIVIKNLVPSPRALQ